MRLFHISCPSLPPSEEEEGALLRNPGSGGRRSCWKKKKGQWFFARSRQWQWRSEKITLPSPHNHQSGLLCQGHHALTAASTLPNALMACCYARVGGCSITPEMTGEPWNPIHGRQSYQPGDERIRPIRREVFVDKAKGSEAKVPPSESRLSTLAVSSPSSYSATSSRIFRRR